MREGDFLSLSKNLNLIKTIAISLVILSHFGPIAYNVIDGTMEFNFFLIYRSSLSCAVPLFLIVSGYLIISKKYEYQKIFKRIIQFLILLFSFKFMYGLAFAKFSFSFDSIVYFFTTTAADGYRVNSLWYLYALIGIFLLLPFIQKLYEDKKIYLLLCLIVLAFTFLVKPIELIFNATFDYELQFFTVLYPFRSHYGFALGYFLLGGLLQRYENKIQDIQVKTPILLLVIGVMIVSQAYFSLLISNLSETTFDPMFDGYKLLTNLVTSVLLFIIIKYRMKEYNHQIIDYIGRNTLLIYLLHWPIAYYVKEYLFNNLNINDYLLNVFGSIIVLLICLAIAKIVNNNDKIAGFFK